MGNYVAVSPEGEKLPVEIVSDMQGNQKVVFPVATLPANVSIKYSIQKGLAEAYPKRTYAEISHKIGGKFVGKNYEESSRWIKTNYLRKPDEIFRPFLLYKI
ncbi:MAG: DUF4861 family protein [Paludibacteraceae bacterium]